MIKKKFSHKATDLALLKIGQEHTLTMKLYQVIVQTMVDFLTLTLSEKINIYLK